MKLAFVFPGQGSQTVGMLDSFADNAVVQAALKTANDALGEDLAEMIHSGPAESLNMTVNTQPAMLTSSVALYQAWLALGGKKPEVMAGHSLGEYSALTAAGGFDLADAVRLVRFRAKAMQENHDFLGLFAGFRQECWAGEGGFFAGHRVYLYWKG